MSSKNVWLAIGALVAVSLAAVFLVRKPPTPKTTAEMPAPGAEKVEEKIVVTEGEVREIEVSGNEYSFNPASISVKKGERLKVVFKNTGNLPHNFVINALDVSTKTIVPGKSDTIEFTAESDTDLEFYCSIGNHKAQGMQGVIKLE